jgi:hypothetical protein
VQGQRTGEARNATACVFDAVNPALGLACWICVVQSPARVLWRCVTAPETAAIVSSTLLSTVEANAVRFHPSVKVVECHTADADVGSCDILFVQIGERLEVHLHVDHTVGTDLLSHDQIHIRAIEAHAVRLGNETTALHRLSCHIDL